jgi:hypothetical protein
VGDEKGKSGRVRRPQSQPAVTSDMLWPVPGESRSGGRERRSLRSSRMNHPSALRAVPEPRVVLSQGSGLVDLSDCGGGCGKGGWCQACRDDIRAEALRWLRELNVPRPSAAGTVLAWSRAWNREILLADR